MSTTKTPAKTTSAAAKKRQAGTKPTYQVVENVFYAQTEGQGEIRIPFAQITTNKLLGLTEVMDHELDALRFLCQEIFPPEVGELGIHESLPLMMRFVEEIGVLAGASLGEPQGSSAN